MGRTKESQPDVLLSPQPLVECGENPRFAYPGLTGQQHDLAVPGFRPVPAARQQFELVLAAYERRQ